MRWFRRQAPASAPMPEPASKRPARIELAALDVLGADEQPALTPYRPAAAVADPFRPYVGPKEAPRMAMDDATSRFIAQQQSFYNFSEGIGFLGYPYLAELAQRAEYRRMSEILAKEMTRRWIRIVSSSDGPEVQDKITAIDAELRRLKAREHFRRAAELDGFFGRGHIYLDTGDTDAPAELTKKLSPTPQKVPKGKLKRLISVEPFWVYPNVFDAVDPLKENFYKPQEWWAMGKGIHSSRLLTFVGREVPDILKPAYAFGGLSMSQMAKPYVDNWLRTRQSVSDLLASFNTYVLKTDLSSALTGGDAQQLTIRAKVFNKVRSNQGLLFINKGDGASDQGEDFKNISVPLGGLNELQAQALEQLSTVSGIPLVKLLGTTPSGLNASSDGEIRVFYDWVNAFQWQVFGENLERLLQIVQLSLFGEIDDGIGFEFEPLWQADPQAEAIALKAEADVDEIYINSGVIAPAEARQRLVADRNSPYANLAAEDLPPDPEDGGEFDPDRDMLSGGEGAEE